ncbi:hypothetical protein SAMN05444671_0699 [Flavobacterium sp. CF108]|uniref:hypothetical protein n=1 Tax=unclassified Flavobacterium TaxID=196869 RepID=UPI0008B758BF|nr:MULTISPECIES: hypothetical protein [unclassified Flavobacterium]SEO20376.1 hypothetical protein SAMN04487978_2379 [Flavobacterium sp. fv08]SHG52747.1 hypothetical protein SAMN05444671_0699 [Flavobacterium sp. CF108]
MGTTVGLILISYDVSDKNKEVKDALIALGYKESWKNAGNEKIYHLPNTTLWHQSKSSKQGLVDMQSVCTNLKVKLEKAISVKATEFVWFN